MTRGLEGRVAFVTGGTGGIGSAICSRLIEEGAAVIVADLPAANPQGLAEQLRATGHEACGRRPAERTMFKHRFVATR